MPSKQTGASAIEFALLLPLMLLLIDGIMEFSILMYDHTVISNAAREAVRAGIVVKSPKLSDDEIRNVALNYAQTYLLSFGNLEALQVDVVQTVGGAYQTPLAVTVTFNYTSLLFGSNFSAFNQALSPMVVTVTQMNE